MLNNCKPVPKEGVVDSRDNQEYKTIRMKDGRVLMVENMKYKTTNFN